MSSHRPVLYSFRRCPYAMRARMALIQSGIDLEHREILLKNKPPSMLEASPKGTVPVLVLPDNTVFEQSFDVMLWALQQNDPQNWLGDNNAFLKQGLPLIEQCDGAFKSALDRYKYADRHPLSAEEYRQQAMPFLTQLDELLQQNRQLLTDKITIADVAIMPFVRQFAAVDRAWFDQCGLSGLGNWLDQLIDSPLFEKAMQKHSLWQF